MKSLQKFASVHASFHNYFVQERHLVDRQTYKLRRSAALAEWQSLASRRSALKRELCQRRPFRIPLTAPEWTNSLTRPKPGFFLIIHSRLAGERMRL